MASYSVSPTRRKPEALEASGTRLTPTSMTQAPSRTMSAVTVPGRARRGDDDIGAPGVRGQIARPVWQTVTVRWIRRLHEQYGQRFTDDVGPADDDDLGADQVHPRLFEHLEHAVGRARDKPLPAPE